MSALSRLDNAELLRRCAEARKAAHEAPRSVTSMAWATRAAEFGELWLEAKRRGFTLADVEAA